MSTVGVTLYPKDPTVPVGDSLILTATVTSSDAEEGATYLVTLDAEGFGEFEGEVPPQLFENLAVFHHRVSAPLKVQWKAVDVPVGTHVISVRVHQLGPNVVDVWRQGLRRISRPHDATDSTTVWVTKAPKEAAVVSMRRADSPPTSDQALWSVIRNSANALSFNNYSRFMDIVMCGGKGTLGLADSDADVRMERDRIKHRLRLPFPDTDAYRQLKVATEVFVMLNCGVAVNRPGFDRLDPGELSAERRRHYDQALLPGGIDILWQQLIREQPLDDVDPRSGQLVRTLPYLAIIRKKLQDVPIVDPKRNRWQQEEEAAVECVGILMEKLTHPCLLELIWSYWHEEGMLVQTMNTITWRFQNRRGPVDRDPLALVEIDPLRPLNNFIWGYIQDEQHRLTVPRRAYEYDHHYGFTLQGKAVPQVRGADSRSRFLEAYHNLLFRCSIFFKEDDDTTVVADGFPVLNALKEVHLLLTQGAHNQYGDLPWTARQEMLMQEWLLARPEFREFLPSRIMVDYPEPWMDRVETMKTLQGWTDTSVMHFRDLGVFGEQILLSVRFGAWPSVIEPQHAANWARYWRPEIQGYIHGYRAVTSVDLTERVDATLPSILLRQRLSAAQQAALPPQRLPATQVSQQRRALR